jgi:ABC-type enterochelin transport system permease subunit
MKKPVYKRDWFWIVALPTALVGAVFVFGLLIRSCA